MFFKQSSDEENNYELNMELQHIPEEFYTTIIRFEQKQQENNIMIPCHIFRQGLSGLESIIKYLKEEHLLKYSQISKLINRDQRTIWTSYNKIKNKKITKITQTEEASFSTSTIKNRNLSVLEAVAVHLKNLGFSIKAISEILGRNNKTIWTVLNRAKNKNNQDEVGR